METREYKSKPQRRLNVFKLALLFLVFFAAFLFLRVTFDLRLVLLILFGSLFGVVLFGGKLVKKITFPQENEKLWRS
uniref:Uncharacterized protein n=1 Tax=Ammonifex degensii TaxID=42838 RepID=A0A7C2HUE5_9THEO